MSEGAMSASWAGTAVDVVDVVDMRLPASSAYLSVLRTATAGLAARLGFTLDEIEDLRIAVDEACAMLLPQAGPEGVLECRFELAGSALRVTVAVPAAGATLPARDTFAWTVLTALAGDVDAGTGNGNVYISLLKRRALSKVAGAGQAADPGRSA